MAIGVHGHKPGVLQETRINAAASTWEIAGHFVNHIVFKPLKAFVHGQIVDGCWRFARINGAAHHGHAQGCFFAA